jgi:hypothetical protein
VESDLSAPRHQHDSAAEALRPDVGFDGRNETLQATLVEAQLTGVHALSSMPCSKARLAVPPSGRRWIVAPGRRGRHPGVREEAVL